MSDEEFAALKEETDAVYDRFEATKAGKLRDRLITVISKRSSLEQRLENALKAEEDLTAAYLAELAKSPKTAQLRERSNLLVIKCKQERERREEAGL